MNTSTQTTVISSMISQDAALPTHVLIPSIVCRNFSTSIHPHPVRYLILAHTLTGTPAYALGRPKHHPVAPAGRCFSRVVRRSDRLLGVRSEVVLVRHAAVDDVV